MRGARHNKPPPFYRLASPRDIMVGMGLHSGVALSSSKTFATGGDPQPLQPMQLRSCPTFCVVFFTRCVRCFTVFVRYVGSPAEWCIGLGLQGFSNQAVVYSIALLRNTPEIRGGKASVGLACVDQEPGDRTPVSRYCSAATLD